MQNNTCPHTLVFDDTAFACVAPCPLPTFSSHEYLVINLVLDILNSISVGVLVISLIFWFQKKMQYPGSHLFHFMLSLLGWHVAMLVTHAFGGRHKSWCADSHTNADQTVAACATEGVMALYFGTSSTLWWFTLVFNAFRVVILRRKPVLTSEWDPVPVVCWTLAALPTAFALGFNRIGYGDYTCWCFISGSQDEGTMSWAAYFAPSALVMVIGLVLGSSVLVRLTQLSLVVRRSMRSLQPESLIPRRADVDPSRRFHIRMFVLIVYFFITLALFVAMQTSGSYHAKDQQHDKDNWVACNMNQFAQPSPDYSLCKLRSEFPFSVLLVGVCFSSTSGFVLAVSFCATRQHLAFWRGHAARLARFLDKKLGRKARTGSWYDRF